MNSDRRSYATDLWVEAHAACKGDRDEMWDWLAARVAELEAALEQIVWQGETLAGWRSMQNTARAALAAVRQETVTPHPETDS